MKDYQDFLAAKIKLSKNLGLEIEASEISPVLFPHQRDIVQWAVRGGRRAIFAAFGLGKSLIQLEIARQIIRKTGGRFLIVCPLGVRQEFRRDATLLGMSPQFVRRNEEVQAEGFYLTNYESVRDGKLDVNLFLGVSLDEASCLRGFGGTKTFREFMRLFEFNQQIKYKFVATATPSPNEYIELLSYAAFLEVMDVGQAKTRFFKRDSTKADSLTIHPHKQREFWLWMSTWAIFLQKPSDLGHSDEGYALPAMEVHWHEIATDHQGAGHERSGQGKLLRNAAIGVQDAAREKRSSLSARIERMVELVSQQRMVPRILPQEQGRLSGKSAEALSKEQSQSEGAEYGMAEVEPGALSRADKKILRQEPRQNQEPKRGLVQRQQEASSRNVSAEQASQIRSDSGSLQCNSREAERSLPDMSTTDEAASSGSLPRDRSIPGNSVPGVQCGSRTVHGEQGGAQTGHQVSQQFLVWCDLNDEQRAIETALDGIHVSYSSLYGAQELEDREELLEAWRRRETTAFVSKPMMYGSGINLQQCHIAIFLGIGFKFADLIQAIHRVHRFLQTHPVEIHLIYTEAEREIRRALEQKWEQHRILTAEMSEIIRTYGLAVNALDSELSRSIGIERVEVTGERFRMVNNDCVAETRSMAPDSVHLILTSIPFSTQYEYTPSYNDFGHTDSNEHFWQQMDFLTPELLRVLQPGRVAAIHVKDRIVPGGMTNLGFQTVYPFHSDCIAQFVRHGFAFLGMKTIVTDVVRENNQTYRLGWTEQCKDGSRMGAGMPEYLLLFRKPPTDRSNGYADQPVVKDKEKYSRSRWQIDAHGFMRSSGNRLLGAEDLEGIPHERIFKLFRQNSLTQVYDFEHHVQLGEALEAKGILPVTFMLLQPQSWHPEVWTDVTRMLSLNSAQSAAGREMHLCPMQFDIADRVIAQFSMEGETVFDPFAGIGTVPFRAVKLKRHGQGVELSAGYFADAVYYCRSAEQDVDAPNLFELTGIEEAIA